MSLLVVGSLALDIIETPFAKLDQALGGSATFISIAASYFSNVGVVGVVGVAPHEGAQRPELGSGWPMTRWSG